MPGEAVPEVGGVPRQQEADSLDKTRQHETSEEGLNEVTVTSPVRARITGTYRYTI